MIDFGVVIIDIGGELIWLGVFDVVLEEEL